MQTSLPAKLAYDRGDYKTALKEWKKLAEQGDVKAQSQLGHIYYHGLHLGRLLDYANALKG